MTTGEEHGPGQVALSDGHDLALDRESRACHRREVASRRVGRDAIMKEDSVVQREAQAEQFRRMHHDGVLVLPNAWDAGSARVLEVAGCPAIATTSGGVAWSYGVPDGEYMTAAQMVEVVERIARVVSVPVTADIEAGYGITPGEVAETVSAIVAAGAVGFNLEDAPGPDGEPLFSIEEQCARIAAAREAGGNIVINTRTDVYLRAVGDPESRFDHAVQRLNAYRAAGADCLFAPGVADADTIGALVNALDGPLNIMVGPGSLSVHELGRLGVARVSLGISLALGALAFTQRAGRAVLETGAYDSVAGSLTFAEIESMLTPAPAQ